jgi:peptide/nickel transport system substrate-binding protein
VVRGIALAAALAVSLLAVSGAGGASEQTPKRGGVVAIPSVEFPCLNVVVNPCRDAVSVIIPAVLQGAYEIGPGYERRPRLVSHVDFTTTPPFTLTYHIRREARWSDGAPITARDFVFTHHARLEHPRTEDDPHLTRVRRVLPVDAKTVKVVLRSRFFFWREALFDVVLPQHALRGENLEEIWGEGIDNPKTGRPIGSGAFLVGPWERGKQLTLTRNPTYWGPHRAYLDRVVVRFAGATSATSPELADLFRRGDVDIIQRQFVEELASALQRVSGARVFYPPDAPGWEHLDIRVGSGGHPALKNKLVRRALAYGIDRVAIVRGVFGGIERTSEPLDSALLRSSSPSYRPNWNGYRYRPQEARRLLARAGCRRGADGIHLCAGQPLSLRFVSRGAARRAQTLELVQAQLGRIGVEVVPLYATQQGHDQVLASGAFDVTLFAWFGPGAEDGSMKQIFGCGGSQNFMGYCQRLVTRDLDQSDRILHEGRRARVLNRADAQIARDLPTIPLFELPLVVAVRSSIRNFTPAGFVAPLWNAEDWWLDR